VSGRALVAGYRLVFGVLTLVAIAAQASSLAGHGIFNPANFLSFFTIESNLIAAAVLLVGVVRWRSGASETFEIARGAAVLYMTVTGVVYFLLLRNVEVDTTLAWVNGVVHQVTPIVMVADWLIVAPLARLTYRGSVLWLAYPFAWIVYTLIRGAITGWYPYPFLNPAHGGYASVALYSLAILLFMLALCAAITATARRTPR
jgi:hypothetical protein